MIDIWLEILGDLNLSRSEEAVVKRFKADPHGRTFLPIADILKNHNYRSEGLELLMQGVARHPQFTVARVILTRELFSNGMIKEAWSILEECPEGLGENVLAQKLRFKLSVLLGYESIARQTYDHIKKRRMYDDEVYNLGEALQISAFPKVREALASQLRDRGIVIPELDPLDQNLVSPDVTGGAAPIRVDAESYKRQEGFYAVPLSEIFKKSSVKPHPEAKVELDSQTLAEIYVRQGHYSKAIEMYKRLLKISPNNDFLQKGLSQAKKLQELDAQSDGGLTAELADQMEQLQIIDVQVKYLSNMLAGLDARERSKL